LRAALLGRHGNAAGEIEQVWRSREKGAPALDAEHDLVAFSEAEGVADGLGDCQLTLRRKLRRDIHFFSLLVA
jgi:hypothetical protein